jgi:accessory colonization factor AcfC
MPMMLFYSMPILLSTLCFLFSHGYCLAMLDGFGGPATHVALIATMYAFLLSRMRMHQNSRPRISYGPLRVMDEERQKNLDRIYNCNDIECVDVLRMRRTPFFRLCNLLRIRNLLADTLHSSVEEQVAIFLHIIWHNQRFRVVHQI